MAMQIPLSDLYAKLGYSKSAGYLARVCRENGLGKKVAGITMLNGNEAKKLVKIVKEAKLEKANSRSPIFNRRVSNDTMR